MQTVNSSTYSTSAEVVVLEEQEGDDLAQQQLNSQSQMKPEQFSDSFSEADRLFKPSESASTPAVLPHFAVHSVAALDCNYSTLPAKTISCAPPQNLPFDNEPPDKNAHPREKQFSSSPNEEVALFAAAPVISVDEYFSTLEEQVIAEFPATFRGHATIFRIYGHSVAWRWRGFRGVKQKSISFTEMLGVWEEQGSAGTCMLIHACLLTSGSIHRQAKAPLDPENHKRAHTHFRLRMSPLLLQACLSKLRSFKDQIEPLFHDILLIYNPVSGSGKARAAFPQVCAVFAAAGARMQILETRQAQHAFDIIHSVENLRMQLIVIIGGDGTVCEVASALLHRPAAKRVPIAVIAGGTQCAVAEAVTFKHAVTAAYHILKAHIIRPLDAMCVILTRPYGALADKMEAPKPSITKSGGFIDGLRKSLGGLFRETHATPAVADTAQNIVSSFEVLAAPASASHMAAPTTAAAAAAAAADAESSSSGGENSESDEFSDESHIVAHPRASASDFESSMLQELRDMRGNVNRMLFEANCLAKDMLCSNDMIWSLCGVSVGFLGEVVQLSEKNRWLPGHSRYLYGGLLSAMEWKDYACTLRILLASEAQQLVGECTAACAVCCGDTGAVDLCDHHPIASPLNASKPTDSSQSPSSMIAADESVDLGLADGWCSRLRAKGVDVALDRLTKEIILQGSFASVSALKVAPRTWDPQSHLSDGCIDVIIVPHLSRADALGVATSFASGRLFKDNHVVFVKATRFSIESMGGHIPVNIDGEPVQATAVQIEVAHKHLMIARSIW